MRKELRQASLALDGSVCAEFVDGAQVEQQSRESRRVPDNSFENRARFGDVTCVKQTSREVLAEQLVAGMLLCQFPPRFDGFCEVAFGRLQERLVDFFAEAGGHFGERFFCAGEVLDLRSVFD